MRVADREGEIVAAMHHAEVGGQAIGKLFGQAAPAGIVPDGGLIQGQKPVRVARAGGKQAGRRPAQPGVAVELTGLTGEAAALVFRARETGKGVHCGSVPQRVERLFKIERPADLLHGSITDTQVTPAEVFFLIAGVVQNDARLVLIAPVGVIAL